MQIKRGAFAKKWLKKKTTNLVSCYVEISNLLINVFFSTINSYRSYYMKNNILDLDMCDFTN